MSKILKADDLHVGMLITVLQGRISMKVLPPTEEGLPRLENKEDERYNGKVLRIKAIDLPYIIVEYYFYKDRKKAVDIDTRRYKLGTVSTEYVKELQPEYIKFVQKEKEDEWVFDQEVGKK